MKKNANAKDLVKTELLSPVEYQLFGILSDQIGKLYMESYEGFCLDIEKATSVTEIRLILKYSAYKHDLSLISSLKSLLDVYEGKHRQVGRRFNALKDILKRDVEKYYQKG